MPLIAYGRSFPRPMCVFLLLMASSIDSVVCGQTIKARLIDGRNGRPVANTCVNVWVGHQRKDALSIPTNKEGVAGFRLTDNSSEVSTGDRWKDCGEFGAINPVFKFEDSVSINAGYVLCQTERAGYSWLKVEEFSTKQLLQQGLVTANTCGTASASWTPGEVVIFVRPLNFWEKLKE